LWVGLFDKRSFPTSAPAFQFLLAGDRVVHVAKMFKPDEPIQMIAFRKPVNFSMPVMVQTTREIIRDPDIQCTAALVCKKVYPVVVVAHVSGNSQRCFASLNMTSNGSKGCHSERSRGIPSYRSRVSSRDVSTPLDMTN